jgi:hypothetical protein
MTIEKYGGLRPMTIDSTMNSYGFFLAGWIAATGTLLDEPGYQGRASA